VRGAGTRNKMIATQCRPVLFTPGFLALLLTLVVIGAVFPISMTAQAFQAEEEKRLEDTDFVEIPADTTIRIRLEEKLSTRRNRNGDVFYAEILDDVLVARGLAVPKGTQVVGRVEHSKRAGRISGRAMLKLEFEAFQFRNGIRVPIQAVLVSVDSKPESPKTTSTIEAKSGTARDATSVGATTGIGALIGSIKGGAKGAVVGAGAGAAIGLAGILAGRGRDVELDAETALTLRMIDPATLPRYTLKILPAH